MKRPMMHEDLLKKDPEQHRVFHEAYRDMAKIVDLTLELTKHLHGSMEDAAYKSGQKHHATAVFMVLDYIDQLNGVKELIKLGMSRCCEPMLRSAFEIVFSFMFLVKDKNEYENRANTYEYWHGRLKHDYYNRMDLSSDSGKAYSEDLKDDWFGDFINENRERLDFHRFAADHWSVFLRPRYASIHAKYEAYKNPPSNWFTLAGGPHRLRNLAKELKLLSLYETFWRRWSGVAHGESAFDRISSKDGKVMDLHAIGGPLCLHEKTMISCNLTMLLNRVIVAKVIPEKRDFFTSAEKEEIIPAVGRLAKYREFDNME